MWSYCLYGILVHTYSSKKRCTGPSTSLYFTVPKNTNIHEIIPGIIHTGCMRCCFVLHSSALVGVLHTLRAGQRKVVAVVVVVGPLVEFVGSGEWARLVWFIVYLVYIYRYSYSSSPSGTFCPSRYTFLRLYLVGVRKSKSTVKRPVSRRRQAWRVFFLFLFSFASEKLKSLFIFSLDNQLIYYKKEYGKRVVSCHRHLEGHFFL